MLTQAGICYLSCFLHFTTVVSSSIEERATQGPLCYQCNLMSDPSQCTNTVRCELGQECMLRELSHNGGVSYTSACAKELVCNALDHNRRRSGHAYCLLCCSTDLCNNHCGTTPASSGGAISSQPGDATRIAPTIGTGLQCYSCDNLANPSACTHVVTCEMGNQCMLREVARDAVNNPIYSAKCERETICRVLSLYGRRSLGCIKCCTTDRCNNHCGADTVTTTTGPAFTQATLPISTHIVTTSGQGIKCYSCGLMSDPAACSNIVTCERGQQCMLKSDGVDMQNHELYSAKCEKDVVCNTLSMIGRRSSRTSCVYCCTTDLCNNNCGHLPSHPPTITSTIATAKLTTAASAPTLIQSSIGPTTPLPTNSGNVTNTGSGVQCYNCDYMADPSRCSNIVQCPIGHVCMLRSVNYNVQGGTHIYKASCESHQSCHMAESLAAGGFSSCVVCCNSDLCNNKCPQQSMTSPTTHVPATSSLSNLPHPTLQPQLPTTTQNASGIGIHCYACGNMASPHDCNHVTICNKNEICFLYESENEIAQRRLFHSRCNTNQVCDVLQHLPPIKSNHTGIELCHTCCSTSLCNNHCDFSNHPTLPPAPTRPPPTTTTTADGIVSTTITREDCENHRYVHLPYADLCFKFHFLNHTWDEAAAVCRAEGGRVATLPTDNQFTIMQTLVGITPEYRHKTVYIGAKDRHHNGTYFWDRGPEMTSQILHARGVSTITSGGCVIMTYSNGYALGIQACTLKGPFICTKP